MATAEDDEYEVPLRDQRVFGAGLKRKRVKFVPSSSNEATVRSLPTTPFESAAERYLSVVFNKSASAERPASAPPNDHEASRESPDGKEELTPADGEDVHTTCDICGQQIASKDATVAHQSSIAHQICLKHSHPPSHLDRRRKGLAVLENQGWDADSRRGLGADGQGILHPIRATENPEKAGLGMDPRDLKVVAKQKPAKLDAGKIRQMEKDGKKKAAKLRDAFYRSESMEKYLGVEGETNSRLDLAAFKRSRRK